MIVNASATPTYVVGSTAVTPGTVESSLRLDLPDHLTKTRNNRVWIALGPRGKVHRQKRRQRGQAHIRRALSLVIRPPDMSG